MWLELDEVGNVVQEEEVAMWVDDSLSALVSSLRFSLMVSYVFCFVVSFYKKSLFF